MSRVSRTTEIVPGGPPKQEPEDVIRTVTLELNWDDEAIDMALANGRTFISGLRALYELIDGELTPLVQMKDVGVGVTASPTGEYLFVLDGVRVLVVTTSTGEVVSSWRAAGESASDVAMSPDGGVIAVVGGDEGGTIKRFEWGAKRASKTRGSIRLGKLVWLDDQRLLALTTSWSNSLRLIDRDFSEATTLGGLGFRSSALAKWGKDIVVGGPEGIYAVDWEGDLTARLVWQGPEVVSLRPARDSMLVGTTEGVFFVRADGSFDHLCPLEPLRLASDARRLGWVSYDQHDEPKCFIATL